MPRESARTHGGGGRMETPLPPPPPGFSGCVILLASRRAWKRGGVRDDPLKNM